MQTHAPPPARQQAVLILGMHRSGTSAFSGMLNERGLFFGDNLIVGNQYNQKGFFEQSEIVILNERLLNKAGFGWETAPGDVVPYLNPLQRFAARMRIRYTVNRTYAAHDIFAIKDPRLCVLLPLWENALRPRYDIRRIFIVRNPREVAKSLERRNGFSQEKSAFLWLAYNLACLTHCVGQLHAVVSFASLIASPEGVVGPIAATLGLAQRPKDAADEFVDPTLRHHHTPADEPAAHELPVLAAAMELYALLLQKGEQITLGELRDFTPLLRESGADL
jgi:hypothetical protein